MPLDEAPATGRIEPAAVYYEAVARNPATSCQFCQHFRLPTDCTRVAGEQISPLGWCELFAAIEDLIPRSDAAVVAATAVADEGEVEPTIGLAAGVMYVTNDGLVLLLRRTDTGEWAFPGGRLKPGETAAEAAARESEEEVGHRPKPNDLYPWTRRIKNGWDFTTFLNRCGEPFDPVLNDEHDAFAWERLGDHVGAAMEALGFVNA